MTLPQCHDRYDRGPCIVASYVKFVEAAGARVVPVPYDLPRDDLRRLLAKLNGVLLTGGETVLREGTPFFDAVAAIYEFAIESNAHGDPFPLLGICQGLEAIASVVAGTTILGEFDARNLSLALEFVYGAAGSRTFPGSRPEAGRVLHLLRTRPITFHQHELGVSPDDFANLMAHDFKLIAVNDDRQGRTFVSAFEGIHAPIFAVQFHPEKHLFEWSRSMDISHDSGAVFANRYLADVFVDVARQSQRTFPDVDRHLIYNYVPVYTGADDFYFDQIYFIAPSAA